MNTVVTEADIRRGLENLGATAGTVLEVHCSMRSFGTVDGGPVTVINALKSAVGSEGAVVMPALKLSPKVPLTEEDKKLGLTLKYKYLTNDDDPSTMGAVSDTFRKMSDVRVGEGIFRVAAWGKNADAYISRGFREVIDADGTALLFGVDIYRLSAMHCAEEYLPKEIKDKFLPSEKARELYPENEWLIEAWAPEAKPWYKIQDAAFQAGLIRTETIGECTCMALPVRPVVNLYREALIKDAFGLYGLR